MCGVKIQPVAERAFFILVPLLRVNIYTAAVKPDSRNRLAYALFAEDNHDPGGL